MSTNVDFIKQFLTLLALKLKSRHHKIFTFNKVLSILYSINTDLCRHHFFWQGCITHISHVAKMMMSYLSMQKIMSLSKGCSLIVSFFRNYIKCSSFRVLKTSSVLWSWNALTWNLTKQSNLVYQDGTVETVNSY